MCSPSYYQDMLHVVIFVARVHQLDVLLIVVKCGCLYVLQVHVCTILVLQQCPFTVKTTVIVLLNNLHTCSTYSCVSHPLAIHTYTHHMHIQSCMGIKYACTQMYKQIRCIHKHIPQYSRQMLTLGKCHVPNVAASIQFISWVNAYAGQNTKLRLSTHGCLHGRP